MSRRLTILSLIFVAGLLCQPSLSFGQQQETIPREFVQTILGGSMFGGREQNPEIFVGTVPDGFPTSLLPTGKIQVLGSVRYSGQTGLGPHTTVIAVIPTSPDSAQSSEILSLDRAGWKLPPPGEREGGFVGAPPARTGSLFCRDSAFIASSTKRRAAGGSYLRLDLYSGGRDTPCSLRPLRARGMYEEIEFPTLVSPPGVASFGGGGGASDWDREASTVLQTDMMPAEIAAHFSNQLKGAGWALGQLAASTEVAIQTAHKHDSKGRLLSGVLSVYSLDRPHARGANFRVMLPDNMPAGR